jgi:hypothetical protein
MKPKQHTLLAASGSYLGMAAAFITLALAFFQHLAGTTPYGLLRASILLSLVAFVCEHLRRWGQERMKQEETQQGLMASAQRGKGGTR